jgi:hypothetical protein
MIIKLDFHAIIPGPELRLHGIVIWGGSLNGMVMGSD